MQRLLSQSFFSFAWIVLILAFTPQISVASADDESIGYYPGSALSLGAGTLGIDFATQRQICVDTSNPLPLKEPYSEASVSIVFNEADFENALHLDESVKANFLGVASGSQNTQIDGSSLRRSDSVYIMFTAYSRLPGSRVGPVTYVGIHKDELANADKTPLTAAQIQSIKADCGDRYVGATHLDARVILLYEIDDATIERRLSAKLGGGAHLDLIDIFSADGKLDLSRSFSEAMTHGHLVSHAYTSGFNNAFAAADIASLGVTPNMSAAEIGQQLHSWILDHTKNDTQNDVIGHYTTMNLSQLSSYIPVLALNQAYEDAYIDLANERERRKATDGYVTSILNGAIESQALKRGDADALRAWQAGGLRAGLNQIDVAYNKCTQAATIDDCAMPPPLVAPPQLPPHASPISIKWVLVVDGQEKTDDALYSLLRSTGQLLRPRIRDLQNRFLAQYPNAMEAQLVAVVVTPYAKGMQFAALGDIFPPYGTTDPGGFEIIPSTVELTLPRLSLVAKTDQVNIDEVPMLTNGLFKDEHGVVLVELHKGCAAPNASCGAGSFLKPLLHLPFGPCNTALHGTISVIPLMPFSGRVAVAQLGIYDIGKPCQSQSSTPDGPKGFVILTMPLAKNATFEAPSIRVDLP